MKKNYEGLFLVKQYFQGIKKYIAEFDFEERNRNMRLRFASSTIEDLVEDMHDNLKHMTQQLSRGQKAITIGSIEGKMTVCSLQGFYTLRPLSTYETGQLLSELKKAGVKTRKR